jgi:hypothetical protein
MAWPVLLSQIKDIQLSPLWHHLLLPGSQ